MKRFFSIILAFFCSQFILGAVTYKKTDVKPGDYVIWDAQHRIYKAIDGGNRGAPDFSRNWTIEDVTIPADMVDKIIAVVIEVFRGDRLPGQEEDIIKKDGESYAGNTSSGRMGNYMIYEKYFSQYEESRLRKRPLCGLYSQDGSTRYHAYIMFVSQSDRKWAYSSDKDNVGPKMEYKIGNDTYSTYIRDGEYETNWQYGMQNKDFYRHMVGRHGYELKFAVTQYNERRGASHRIKPNHWALECDKICPLNGVTSTWMVPTKNEIMSMSWEEKPINSSLKRLRLAGRKDCQEIKTGERYWTIQEYSKGYAYSWYLSEHDVVTVDASLEKPKERYVRTIAAL